MSDDGALMQVAFRVPLAAAEVFDAALEPFCDALSWLESEDDVRAEVTGYAAAGLDADAVQAALKAAAEAAGVDVPEATITPVPAHDWVAETQKAFPPVAIGRFFIHGDHVTATPPHGALPLCIGAGAAFGTGEHESTAGCLMALETLARRHRPRRLLDMGCGTGILALAAAKLWPRAGVLGVDVDGGAVAVARTNAAVNGMGMEDAVRFDMSDGYRGAVVRRGAPYDLIIANILARPLMTMAPDLACHLAPGGVAVLAGFLNRDAGRVLAAHRAQGLTLLRRIPVNGWTTLVLRRG